jgi:nucleotide-binding universal stress UspA family protein
VKIKINRLLKNICNACILTIKEIMVNILVPTDLSQVSKVAATYAVKMANLLEANLTLIHVITVVVPVRSAYQRQLKNAEDGLLRRTHDEMLSAMKPVAKQARFAAPIQYYVAIGSPFSDTLLKEAKKLRTGLIVMGTLGASGLKKVVIGSNTTALIGESPIPVLAVPEAAEFKGLKDIVYASDMRNLKRELKQLVPYASIFGSTIHIVHVVASGDLVDAIEEKMQRIITQVGYENVVMIVLADENVDDAIADYIKINRADLLVMFTHKPNFYERLFDKSVTRRMAFHSKVPLLAFRNT